jgi:hypothetical protein
MQESPLAAATQNMTKAVASWNYLGSGWYVDATAFSMILHAASAAGSVQMSGSNIAITSY